jgi:hypothetical protein
MGFAFVGRLSYNEGLTGDPSELRDGRMHIKTTCPRCESTFQVEATLRGKRMRCPNPACRLVFEVREVAEPPPAPTSAAPPTQRKGSVGEIVPILEAEQVESAPARDPPSAHPPGPSRGVQEIVPLLSAEAVGPKPPPPAAPPAPARAPRPAPHEVPSILVPPPVRTRGRPAAPPAPPSKPPPPPPSDVEARPAPPVEAPPTPQTARPATVAQPPRDEPALDAEALDLLRELGLAEATAGATTAVLAAPSRPDTGPVEYAAGAWDAPPVRGAAARSDTAQAPTAAAPSTPTRHRRRSRLAVAAMLLVVVGVIGGVFWAMGHFSAETEAERARRAFHAYGERNFADASQMFLQMTLDFPRSTKLDTYRFMSTLSSLREPLHLTQTDPAETVKHLQWLMEFAAEHRDNPLLQERHGELRDTFQRGVEELLEFVGRKKGAELLEAAALLEAAHKTHTYALQYKPAPGKSYPDLAPRFAEMTKNIAATEFRLGMLDLVKASREVTTADTVQQIRARVAAAGFAGDPEFAEYLAKLPAEHRRSVKYHPPEPGVATLVPPDDREPSLLVAAELVGYRGPPRRAARPVFAVARGVLYVLEPEHGAIRWALRVGVDVTTPPLWISPTAVSPELVLVLSSDGRTLSARDAATGAPLWRHRLSSPCLCRPVLVGARAYLPTYGGRVEEVETAGGRLLGYYELGQPLTAGAVHQPGTSLLYVAADSFAVYALDLDRRTCAAVLYTGHSSGSLLGPPVVLSAADGGAAGAQRGKLLVAQTDGLGAMKLRAFALPVAEADAKAVEELTLPGWAGSPPYLDAEKLAQITDTGDFLLAGIGRRGEQDPPFFPILRETVPPALVSLGAGRAMLLHHDAERFWAVAHGRVLALTPTFTRPGGPRLAPYGPGITTVGSPLHAAQAETDAAGNTTLYLTSQSAGGQTCLVTAIDVGQRRVLWQRRLGLACSGQPAVAGGKVLAEDRSGDLFLFDPAKLGSVGGREWSAGGTPLKDPARGQVIASYMLPAGEGVLAVTCHLRRSGAALSVRRFRDGQDSARALEFALDALLAGTPAVAADALILPLESGILVRQPLTPGAAASKGINWRANEADEKAPCHVIALGADEFLATDGSRGLIRLRSDGKVWEKTGALELGHRIISAPALLVAADASAQRVCVADTANVVTLLDAASLKEVRRWPLSGQITAGPFVRGGGIGCVVEGRRLVWLDPQHEKPLWAVDFRTPVVGLPEVVGGLLIVAEQGGQFHGLDPATGRAPGAGYRLTSSAAPTAAPVAFGADRLFVPLTDGTVLLLSRRHFQHPLQGFPLLR